LIAILVVALVIFGPSRLPQLGRSIGKLMRELRQGAKEMGGGIKEGMVGMDEADRAGAPPPPPPPAGSAQGATPGATPSQAPSPAEPVEYCTNCGVKVPPAARFCGSCGAKLKD